MADPSNSHYDEENPTGGDEQDSEIVVKQKGLSGMSMKEIVAQFGPTFEAYFYGTVATGIKTFAWWLNQWPFLSGWNYFSKWALSAGVAGMEYLPLTMAMQTASKKGVHLGLMTAYMEAADNFLRMMQQLGLGDVLDWFDWFAAFLLGVCVAWQGYKHYYSDQVIVRQASARKLPQPSAQVEEVEMEQPVPLPEASDAQAQANADPVGSDQDRRNRRNFAITLIVIVAVVSIIGSAAGGATGQAYVLATVATAAKTFAWWINQYPQLQHLNFYQKWLAGWSIAALIEYLPLMGAFTIASENMVHLGLMTAYMEALDNFFRICQQKILGKPLAWYDLVAAAGMFVAVMFQGIMRYSYDHSSN